MATYFHGNSEMQGNGDGLQTLILMNPAYVGYSENQQPPPPATNCIFLNSSSSAAAVSFSHPPPSQIPHFAGIPIQAAASSQDVSELHGGALPRFHYNLYNPLISSGAAALEVTRAKQGLSLSLSSQQPTVQAPSHQTPETAAPLLGVGEVRVPSNVLVSSKYLKVAQELLDEVVSIGKEAKNANESAKEDNNGRLKITAESSGPTAGDGEIGGGDEGAKRGAELTTAEKHEIQMKKAKLVNMLDEVEQRYKQYEQQMQTVITWFEQAAGGGGGSAKTYTALALQTISKQFRCLKDAISAQIRAAAKSLGEDDHMSFGGKMEGGSSRLKYIDSHIRQQRALQQLGMIHHNNAWRPQRGLPERSVSVLRAWLFEHFLHPYPKDTDKSMLAKQAGLTRSQVSNWFINARVRLWKPMVEEMYAEEMRGHQGNGSEDKTAAKAEISTSKSTASQAKDAGTEIKNYTCSSTSPAQVKNNVGFNLIGSSEMDSITREGRSPKKPRNADVSQSPSLSMQPEPSDVESQQMCMNLGYERQEGEGFTITGVPMNFFGSYPIVGLQQFQPPYSGNGVSLTLGLQHCENQNFQLPNRSMQLGRGVETGQGNDFGSLNAPTTGVYDNIDIQNSKRFAAQWLQDFVT